MPATTPTLAETDLYAQLSVLKHPEYFENREEYRASLVWAGLADLPLPQDRATLEDLESGIGAAILRLPARLDAPGEIIAGRLSLLRRCVLARLARLDQQQRACDALLARIYDPPGDDQADAQDASQDTPQTAQERAVRLMRAALMLIMDDRQDRPDGGTRVRLTPRPPTLPPGGPGGNAVAVPTAPKPVDDFQF